jgi:hypothetical protein
MAVVTAAAIGAATTVGSAYMANKQAKKQGKMAQESIAASDPFGKYRPEYAEKLNKLMEDPSSITDTPEYKARQTAAARQMSAQGYTGSGNAIIEAAEAGGASFKEAADRLGGLAGAGATPGAGYANAMESQQAGDAQKLSAYQGVASSLGNLASTWQARPKAGAPMPVTRQAIAMPKPTVSVSNIGRG